MWGHLFFYTPAIFSVVFLSKFWNRFPTRWFLLVIISDGYHKLEDTITYFAVGRRKKAKERRPCKNWNFKLNKVGKYCKVLLITIYIIQSCKQSQTQTKWLAIRLFINSKTESWRDFVIAVIANCFVCLHFQYLSQGRGGTPWFFPPGVTRLQEILTEVFWTWQPGWLRLSSNTRVSTSKFQTSTSRTRVSSVTKFND